MKRAQLIGFGIAGISGLIAFVGMQGVVNQETVVKKETIDTVDILVARKNFEFGDAATGGSLGWRKWPKEALVADYITRQSKPDAIKKLAGRIANSTIMKNDPIMESKLIEPGKGSILSAILPSGKRAISTEITDATAAGKLILPNDRVDVLVSMRVRGGRGGNRRDINNTEIILRNIRVLAIGKEIEVENKENGADGKVATLELTPSQTKILASANVRGKISLALRSIADNQETRESERPRAEPPKVLYVWK